MAAAKEAQIMSRLSHENIIKFYTSFLEDKFLYILMEYASKGDLFKMIHE